MLYADVQASVAAQGMQRNTCRLSGQQTIKTF
jgi:hypothetical protein